MFLSLASIPNCFLRLGSSGFLPVLRCPSQSPLFMNKYNYFNNVTLVKDCKPTKLSSVLKNKKTKKCQPVAGDMPDLIQTVHVPSKRAGTPKKNIYRMKKIKNTKTTLNPRMLLW